MFDVFSLPSLSFLFDIRVFGLPASPLLFPCHPPFSLFSLFPIYQEFGRHTHADSSGLPGTLKPWEGRPRRGRSASSLPSGLHRPGENTCTWGPWVSRDFTLLCGNVVQERNVVEEMSWKKGRGSVVEERNVEETLWRKNMYR